MSSSEFDDLIFRITDMTDIELDDLIMRRKQALIGEIVQMITLDQSFPEHPPRVLYPDDEDNGRPAQAKVVAADATLRLGDDPILNLTLQWIIDPESQSVPGGEDYEFELYGDEVLELGLECLRAIRNCLRERTS